MFGINIILYNLLINHCLPSVICLLQLPISLVQILEVFFWFCLFISCYTCFYFKRGDSRFVQTWFIHYLWELVLSGPGRVPFTLIYCAVTFDLLPATGSARLTLPAGKPQNCHALPHCMCALFTVGFRSYWNCRASRQTGFITTQPVSVASECEREKLFSAAFG